MTNLADVCVLHLLHISVAPDRERIRQLLNQNKVFGVFVTIKRSQKHRRNTYPFDIHGCMGYWDPNKEVMDPDMFLNMLRRRTDDAAYKDDRRSYFSKNLFLDSEATVEVTLMKKPLIAIDSTTGRLMSTSTIRPKDMFFSNENYGLLFESKQHTATYLPHVFHNTQWSQIARDLMSKAGLHAGLHAGFHDHSATSFWAYEAVVTDQKLGFGLSDRRLLTELVVRPVNNTVIGAMKQIEFLPYERQTQNGLFQADPSETVRNLGFLFDLMSVPITMELFEMLMRFYRFYRNHYNIHDDDWTKIFDVLVRDRLDMTTQEDKKDLERKLDMFEEEFELGEAIYAIGNTKLTRLRMEKMLENDITQRRGLKVQDVFRLNWHALALTRFDKYSFPRREDLERNLAILLEQIVTSDALRDANDSATYLETNFLVVLLEALSSLQFYRNTDFILYVFEKVMTRRDPKDFLLNFGNSSARLDITGHFFHAVHFLLLRSV